MNLEAEIAALKARMSELEAKARAAGDYIDISNLQRAYGYYVDKMLWDEAADLFSKDATLEIAGRGLFIGRDRLRAYLHRLGKLDYGILFNHMQLQPIITVGPDGVTAKGRWRVFIQLGFLNREARWGEGTYENEYVKEDGVWKISKLHMWTTFYVEYDKGWNKGGVPLAPPLEGFTPDREVTTKYGAFPDVFIPPFHYRNPVTGR